MVDFSRVVQSRAPLFLSKAVSVPFTPRTRMSFAFMRSGRKAGRRLPVLVLGLDEIALHVFAGDALDAMRDRRLPADVACLAVDHLFLAVRAGDAKFRRREHDVEVRGMGVQAEAADVF